MKFTLPPLPYAEDALAPVISAETLHLHHGAHHRAYVDKLNELLDGKSTADKSLLEVVLWSAGAESRRPIFNNAAQAWNHAFYWESLRAPGNGGPQGELAASIDRSFSGLTALKKALLEAAVAHFGSGWAWLVLDKRKLKVVTTHDAGTPVIAGQHPLLAIDLWEHAYYVDYRNKRPDHVTAVVDRLLNWDFAAVNLSVMDEPIRKQA
jgi:superoxide dismutase, Fe-Mn family